MQRAMLFACAVLVLLTGPSETSGQSGNYWTENFGNRSMLLSGAVIGSVSDLGLVFYNPGRLSLIEKPAFVITAKAYQWDRLRFEDGLGDGVDLEDSYFGGAPSLAAGAFTVPFLKGHRFAYAFLTRRRDDTDLFLRTERSGDILEQNPGEEFFTGTVDIQGTLKEEWIGLTWSHALGGNWGLGVSTVYYDLSRKVHFGLDLKALTEANELVVLARTRGVNIHDQGLLWKAGLAGVFDPVSLGITVTSPRVSVLMSGKIQYEDLLTGLGTGNGQTAENGLVSSFQKDLPAVSRSPWAVGAGVGVDWGRARLHLSGEWYSAVPKYIVTRAEPFVGQSTGELTEYRVVEELESVLNGAVGIEWHQAENLSFFASVATDRSAAPPERSTFLELKDETSTTTVRMDFLQVGGGVVVSTSRFDLTFGASRARASDKVTRPVDLPDGGDGPVFGNGENARYVASRWRFLLGFSFPFAEQLAEKVKEVSAGNGGK
jgi:hypothetical protein